MSTFRRYGGLNYSANNNITKSYISNSEQTNTNNYSGQQNSKEVFASHIDMSGNSILHTGCVYFQDGTVMCTAANAGATGPAGAEYWLPDPVGAGIYYDGPVQMGNITALGTITAGSDYRIKNEIKPLLLEDYSVNNLKPVTFKFKKDNKESIGLIAHELQEYYPFLVEGEKDGKQTQTVNYNGLIGVLIKEIQELKKRVLDLEKKLK